MTMNTPRRRLVQGMVAAAGGAWLPAATRAQVINAGALGIFTESEWVWE
ncbi:MAG: hypothetical protein ACJ8HJ_26900 [Massilia sp.]